MTSGYIMKLGTDCIRLGIWEISQVRMSIYKQINNVHNII